MNIIRIIFIPTIILLAITVSVQKMNAQSVINCEIHTASKEKFNEVAIFLQIPFINASIEKLNINNGIVYLTNNSYGHLYGIVLNLDNELHVVDGFKVRIEVSNKVFELAGLKRKSLKKYRKILVDSSNIKNYYASFCPHHHKDLDMIIKIESRRITGGFVSNSFNFIKSENDYVLLIKKIIAVSKNKW